MPVTLTAWVPTGSSIDRGTSGERGRQKHDLATVERTRQAFRILGDVDLVQRGRGIQVRDDSQSIDCRR